MEPQHYVHGYSSRESERLNDQADTLDTIIHGDSIFPAGSLVLEAGCGVGAQTKIVAVNNPGCHFYSIDISEESIGQAQKMAVSRDVANVRFCRADIYRLPFADACFDAVVICFVLEHLSRPLAALLELKRVVKPGGTFMLIEGDHGSTLFHPDSIFARKAIDCQVALQREAGGNSNIGRELYPLMQSAGLSEIAVAPRMVYVDASHPQLVEGFTKNTFTAMIEGVGDAAVQKGLIDRASFDRGIRDLYRTARPDGVFCYTFFKGWGRNGPADHGEAAVYRE